MNNIEILQEIYKGAKTGLDSIGVVSTKVQDETFQNDLSTQRNEYKEILDKSEEMLKMHGESPVDTSWGQKVMGWTGIQMNTIIDKSNSQIADLLIQGTTMGIVKGIQLLHSQKDMNKDIKNVLDNFVKMQENHVERLKEFL